MIGPALATIRFDVSPFAVKTGAGRMSCTVYKWRDTVPDCFVAKVQEGKGHICQKTFRLWTSAWWRTSLELNSKSREGTVWVQI